MMNAWMPMTSASPTASSERKSSAAAAPMRRPRSTTTRYSPRIATTPTSPSSSPSAASGKSVWTSGIGRRPPISGRPAPRPDPEQPAAGERVERLDDLVAGAERVGERVDPDVDPGPDVVEQHGHQRAAEQEQDEADDDQADPAGRDVEQRQEDAEEQQRRPEVALDDDDAEGDRPHRDHRREVRQRRQPQRPEPRVLLDRAAPVLRQVAGQEDDEDDLEQLRRLAAERAELEGQALAVDLRAEHERQQQQADPDRRPGVLVAAQPAVGADDDPERRRDGERQHAARPAGPGPARASVPKNVWVTRSCGSRCMSSSEIPPSIADRRQQDLVGPPAGEDLGERGRRSSATR